MPEKASITCGLEGERVVLRRRVKPSPPKRGADVALMSALQEEMFSALFTIVRQNAQGYPIGHDAMVAARSIVRRVAPDAYADMERRAKRNPWSGTA